VFPWNILVTSMFIAIHVKENVFIISVTLEYGCTPNACIQIENPMTPTYNKIVR